MLVTGSHLGGCGFSLLFRWTGLSRRSCSVQLTLEQRFVQGLQSLGLLPRSNVCDLDRSLTWADRSSPKASEMKCYIVTGIPSGTTADSEVHAPGSEAQAGVLPARFLCRHDSLLMKYEWARLQACLRMHSWSESSRSASRSTDLHVSMRDPRQAGAHPTCSWQENSQVTRPFQDLWSDQG